MKRSQIKQTLAQEDLLLTKSLGQNFLHDQNQLQRIVRAAELNLADRVIEIGPGLGPLTELLLSEVEHVFAIEKDRRLAECLAERLGGRSGLNLLTDDALEYIRREQPDWSAWKLVSNLPYSVASPILVEIGQLERPPQRLIVTLQREVAQRISAQAGAEDYGVLSLLIQLQFQPKGWFKIPASCFFPRPKVDSTCLTLLRREGVLLEPPLRKPFLRIVKRAFSQRRKMMLKLLKQDWASDRLEHAFKVLNLSPAIRAERVSLHQFIQLTRLLAAPQK